MAWIVDEGFGLGFAGEGVGGVIEEAILDGFAAFAFKGGEVELVDFSRNEILELKGNRLWVELFVLGDGVDEFVFLRGAIGPLGLVGEGLELEGG